MARGSVARPAQAFPVLGRNWRVGELAAILDCSRLTILRAIRAGQLRAVEKVFFRSHPQFGPLRRRYYQLPDLWINEWLLVKYARALERHASTRPWPQKPERTPKPE